MHHPEHLKRNAISAANQNGQRFCARRMRVSRAAVTFHSGSQMARFFRSKCDTSPAGKIASMPRPRRCRIASFKARPLEARLSDRSKGSINIQSRASSGSSPKSWLVRIRTSGRTRVQQKIGQQHAVEDARRMIRNGHYGAGLRDPVHICWAYIYLNLQVFQQPAYKAFLRTRTRIQLLQAVDLKEMIYRVRKRSGQTV